MIQFLFIQFYFNPSLKSMAPSLGWRTIGILSTLPQPELITQNTERCEAALFDCYKIIIICIYPESISMLEVQIN